MACRSVFVRTSTHPWPAVFLLTGFEIKTYPFYDSELAFNVMVGFTLPSGFSEKFNLPRAPPGVK